MKPAICFVDTETHHNVDPHIIQLAVKKWGADFGINEYFSLPEGLEIHPAAQKVNKITMEMIEGKPLFVQSETRERVMHIFKTHIFVAHHASFDADVLQRQGVQIGQRIDTLRVAKHILERSSLGLQSLREHFAIRIQADAHDAWGDVLVLERVFEEMLKLVKKIYRLLTDQQGIEKMLELSRQPAVMKYVPYKKHRDKTFAEVAEEDPDFLSWIYAQEMKKPDGKRNMDTVLTMQHYGVVLPSKWKVMWWDVKRAVRKAFFRRR